MVQEFVVPAAPASIPPAIAAIDLTMLVLEGGRERTAAEFGALFRATGFEFMRVVPLTPPRGVIEGVWLKRSSE